MTSITVQKTSAKTSKDLKLNKVKVENPQSEPVVNQGFKGILGVFKSFLLVGGDLV